MTKTRRLKGVAALSAGALATVGIAGGAAGADECTDEACLEAQQLSEFMAAFGMGGDGAAGDAFLKYQQALIKVSQDASPEALAELQEAMLAFGIGGLDPALLKIATAESDLGPIEDLFIKLGAGDFAELDELFPTIDEAFAKVEGDMPEAFVQIEEQYQAIEETLMKLGESGQLSPEMLQSILALLRQNQ